MGNTVGVFHDGEVSHLSDEKRTELRRHAVEQLQNHPEIRKLMETKPKLFADIPEVNAILTKKLKPVLDNMK